MIRPGPFAYRGDVDEEVLLKQKDIQIEDLQLRLSNSLKAQDACRHGDVSPHMRVLEARERVLREQLVSAIGYIDTALECAESMPQEGGEEASIQEQLVQALTILRATPEEPKPEAQKIFKHEFVRRTDVDWCDHCAICFEAERDHKTAAADPEVKPYSGMMTAGEEENLG